MDGVQGAVFPGAASLGSASATPAWRPASVDSAQALVASVPGLFLRRIEGTDALVVTKTMPGFNPAAVAALGSLVRAVGRGELGEVKFLVFDFAHEGFPLSLGADGFEPLIAETANLILAAPVITVAVARANLAGADLEFALACSMVVGEAHRRFSFAGDAAVSTGTYGLLAQKIGFVRAERLMEKGEIISAEDMAGLYLVKEVIAEAGDLSAVEDFLRRVSRRHNASVGIYRAQRMALRPTHEGMRV